MASQHSDALLQLDTKQKLSTLEEANDIFSSILQIAVESDRELKAIDPFIVAERNEELRKTITESYKTNMTIKELFNKLIFQVSLLCKNADTTYWGLVAGRLRTMLFWADGKTYKRALNEHIDHLVEKGIYGRQVLKRLKVFSREDYIELNKTINPDYDLLQNTGAVIVSLGKYLRPFKNAEEAVQQMYMLNSMIIGSVEKDPVYRLQFTKELYELLATRKLSLATPWLGNLRGDGNISSCFILEIEDDIESIIAGWGDIARISKNGGGVGVYIGNMRAKGATVNNVLKAAKGINSWGKIIDSIASTVDQGGVRKGAVTLAVPIWHRDVDDFLEIQTEVGDLRTKAFDIFPQVTCPDLFYKQSEANSDWLTFCPKEVRDLTGIDVAHSYGEEFEKAYWLAYEAYKNGELKNFRYYAKANDLMKHVMRTQFETGMPYMANIDTINRNNPNKHAGFIPCVNLCTESFSVVKAGKWTHCCNLASIVMTNIHTPQELKRVTKVATRVLDYGIDLTDAPSPTAKQHNEDFRTIGIGITGLHDFLARENVMFSDTYAMATFAKNIEYYAIEESIELAKEYAPYGQFKGSMWDTGEKLKDLAVAAEEMEVELKPSRFMQKWLGDHLITSEKLLALQEKIDKHGIRNSQLTSPAPNTGTSIITESSASILPIYNPFFIESGGEGLKIQYGAYVDQNPLHYSRSFATYTSIQINTYVGWMQRFIDTGISMEMIFDRNDPTFDAKTAYDSIMDAWKKGIKAIYYIRTIKEGSTFEALINSKAKSVCVGCAN